MVDFVRCGVAAHKTSTVLRPTVCVSSPCSLRENRSNDYFFFFALLEHDRQRIHGRWRLASFQRRVCHTTATSSPSPASFSSFAPRRTCANKFPSSHVEQLVSVDPRERRIFNSLFIYFHFSSVRGTAIITDGGEIVQRRNEFHFSPVPCTSYQHSRFIRLD